MHADVLGECNKFLFGQLSVQSQMHQNPGSHSTNLLDVSTGVKCKRPNHRKPGQIMVIWRGGKMEELMCDEEENGLAELV